jgi:hypothetical protein
MIPYWNYVNEAFVQKVWPESEDIDPEVYTVLMSTANALCVAYAPLLPEGEEPSDSWKLAEIFQARHTWGQMSGGNREEYGPDGMAIPVYPLFAAAQNLLRPPSSPLSRLR